MASKQLLQSAVQSSNLMGSFAAANWMRQGALGGMMHLSSRPAAPSTPFLSTSLSPTPAGLIPLPARSTRHLSSATSKLAHPATPLAAQPLLESSKAYATAAVDAEESNHYNIQVKWLHWLMAGAIITCMLLIQAARGTKDGAQKGYYMMLHKSIGVSTLALISYRSVLRFTTKIPPHLPGPVWEHWAAFLSHIALYGFMWFMPLSGVVMGYYGGKGLPFFGYTIPGRKEPIGAYAKTAFQTHKQVGYWFQWFVPLHAGAAFYHRFKGQWIFERVNPFAAARIA